MSERKRKPKKKTKITVATAASVRVDEMLNVKLTDSLLGTKGGMQAIIYNLNQ